MPEKEISDLAKKYVKRRVYVSTDGPLLLENSLQYDFKMRLLNPDVAEGEMCGNGGRCIAKYVFKEGW
jgi:diaminopimelate epimerase